MLIKSSTLILLIVLSVGCGEKVHSGYNIVKDDNSTTVLPSGVHLTSTPNGLDFQTPDDKALGQFGALTGTGVSGPCFGSRHPCLQAIRGANLTGSRSIAPGCMLYGPYIQLPAAGYVVGSVFVHLDGHVTGHVNGAKVAFRVDLVSDAGTRPLANGSFRNVTFAEMLQHASATHNCANCYEDTVDVTAEITEARDNVELRVCNVVNDSDIDSIELDSQEIKFTPNN